MSTPGAMSRESRPLKPGCLVASIYDDLLAVRRAGAIARPFLQSLMKI